MLKLYKPDGSSVDEPEKHLGYKVDAREVKVGVSPNEGDFLVDGVEPGDRVQQVVEGQRQDTRFKIGQIMEPVGSVIGTTKREVAGFSRRRVDSASDAARTGRDFGSHHKAFREVEVVPQNGVTRRPAPTLEEIFEEPYMTRLAEEKKPARSFLDSYYGFDDSPRQPKPDRVVFNVNPTRPDLVAEAVKQFSMLALSHGCALRVDRDRLIVANKEPNADIGKVVSKMKEWGDETVGAFSSDGATKVVAIERWKVNKQKTEGKEDSHHWNSWFLWREEEKSATFKACAEEIPGLTLAGHSKKTHLVIDLSKGGVKAGALMAELGKTGKVKSIKHAKALVIELSSSNQSPDDPKSDFQRTIVPVLKEHKLSCAFAEVSIEKPVEEKVEDAQAKLQRMLMEAAGRAATPEAPVKPKKEKKKELEKVEDSPQSPNLWPNEGKVLKGFKEEGYQQCSARDAELIVLCYETEDDRYMAATHIDSHFDGRTSRPGEYYSAGSENYSTRVIRKEGESIREEDLRGRSGGKVRVHYVKRGQEAVSKPWFSERKLLDGFRASVYEECGMRESSHVLICYRSQREQQDAHSSLVQKLGYGRLKWPDAFYSPWGEEMGCGFVVIRGMNEVIDEQQLKVTNSPIRIHYLRPKSASGGQGSGGIVEDQLF